jgi:hypothetical protein
MHVRGWVRESTHLVMATWVGYNHFLGRVGVKQAWEKKEIRVGRGGSFDNMFLDRKGEMGVGKEQ